MSHSNLRQKVAALLGAIDQASIEGDGPVTSLEVATAVVELRDAFDADNEPSSDVGGSDTPGAVRLILEEVATVLAALRFYRQKGLGDPDNRSDDIHDIATDGGDLTSLDADGIDDLCERLNREKCALATGRLLPIKFAPRDGSFVLLAGPSGYTTTPLRFMAGRWSKDRGAWVNHANDRVTDDGSEPTLFMPIPVESMEDGRDDDGLSAYTVFIQQSDGVGTIHITSHRAASVSDARKQAIEETMSDWGEDDENALHVLGVAEGDLNILEWEDVYG